MVWYFIKLVSIVIWPAALEEIAGAAADDDAILFAVHLQTIGIGRVIIADFGLDFNVIRRLEIKRQRHAAEVAARIRGEG